MTTDLRITRLCNEMNHAALAGQFDRTVALIYPKLVALVGADALTYALKSSLDGTDQFKVTVMDCSAPTRHSTAGGLDFALVPIVTRARVGNQFLQMDGYDLAVSDDHGAHWTFLYVTPKDTEQTLRPVIPEGLGGLTWPTAPGVVTPAIDAASAP